MARLSRFSRYLTRHHHIISYHTVPARTPPPPHTHAHTQHGKNPDAEVEPVLIPEKELLDPESTPTFEEEGSTDAQGTSRGGQKPRWKVA